MTVQDNVQSLIRQLEQILWQDTLKAHPEVSILLERIRHHLLMSHSTLNNQDHLQAEQLSETILHRLESTPENHILPGEVQKLQEQRETLLEEIATLQQQKQAILSNFSPSSEHPLNINSLTTSVDQNFQPLLNKLNLYSDSLEEGIKRMEELGQQGETKFLAYLNRLQEKLELFLQEEKIDKKNTISDSWYLGFEIENKQIKGYLFTFSSADKCTAYSFSELLGSANVKLLAHDNLLENIKEQLTAFNQIVDISWITVDNNRPLKTILGKIKAIVLIGSSKWTQRDRSLLQKIIREQLKLSQAKEIVWIPKPITLTLSYGRKNTLSCVINLTETITELSIVDLSKQGMSGIISQQLFYGNHNIDQDILGHLIYPQWSEKITLTFPHFPQSFPTPGMAEMSKRKALKEYLGNNSVGNALIKASQLTRLILQKQEEFTSTLSGQCWSVNRQEMIEIVINPWIKSINKKFKTLLSQGQYSPDSISQIILAGQEISSLDYALIPWLTQMFPNAEIIEPKKQWKESQLFAGLHDFLANIEPKM